MVAERAAGAALAGVVKTGERLDESWAGRAGVWAAWGELVPAAEGEEPRRSRSASEVDSTEGEDDSAARRAC